MPDYLAYLFIIYEDLKGVVRSSKPINLCIAVENESLIEGALRGIAQEDGFSKEGYFNTNEDRIHYYVQNDKGDHRRYHCNLKENRPVPIRTWIKPSSSKAA